MGIGIVEELVAIIIIMVQLLFCSNTYLVHLMPCVYVYAVVIYIEHLYKHKTLSQHRKDKL